MDAERLLPYCRKFDELEGRASYYGLATEMVSAFPLHASVILLATWNAGRFRVVEDKGQLLEELRSALPKCVSKLSGLSACRLSDADFNDRRISAPISYAYGELSRIKGVEHTGASKVMSLLNAELFVMWDDYIRDCYSVEESAEGYLKFLGIMKKDYGHVEWDNKAIVPHRTLAKAIDERNFVSITLPEQLGEGIARLEREIPKKKGKRKENAMKKLDNSRRELKELRGFIAENP